MKQKKLSHQAGVLQSKFKPSRCFITQEYDIDYINKKIDVHDPVKKIDYALDFLKNIFILGYLYVIIPFLIFILFYYFHNISVYYISLYSVIVLGIILIHSICYCIFNNRFTTDIQMFLEFPIYFLMFKRKKLSIDFEGDSFYFLFQYYYRYRLTTDKNIKSISYKKNDLDCYILKIIYKNCKKRNIKIDYRGKLYHYDTNKTR